MDVQRYSINEHEGFIEEEKHNTEKECRTPKNSRLWSSAMESSTTAIGPLPRHYTPDARL